MRALVIAMLLGLSSCKSVPAERPTPPESAAVGPIDVIEASTGGTVERMHPDGADWVALVTVGANWELVRLRRAASGEWNVVERTDSTEYYLWPTQ